MAKKSAKKTTGRKRTRSATRAPGQGRPAGKKPARAGDAQHVLFGVHGMAHIINAVREAGLESKLNNKLRPTDTFMKVRRTGLATIKEFAKSESKLTSLYNQMEQCDCHP